MAAQQQQQQQGKEGAASEAELNASAKALDALTSHTIANHAADPQATLHLGAGSKDAHPWLHRFFPETAIERFETSYQMGNYVLDRQTGAKTFESMSIYVRVGMHLLYHGSAQEHALHWQRTLGLLKEQSEKMGAEYDDPRSAAHIPAFIASFDLASSMAEMVEPDPARYATFNDFFAREIRPDARPPAEPANDLVTSSPADCRLTAFGSVDAATRCWIKGYGFTLARLLGSDELGARFAGGSVVIARLAPQDYHRWHAPVSGTVLAVTDIPGAYYTVNPQAINEAGTVDVFCENRRSVMLVERAATRSPVAVVAVGAMLVGSIRYVDGLGVPGARFRRGQCLGKFLYGGSTVIVVYPRGEVELDADLLRNSEEEKCETLMRVGWRTGITPRR